jgi:hypothetical protein
LNNSSDQSIQEAKLNEYNDEVTKLWEKLMSLEVLVVDQLEVKSNIIKIILIIICLTYLFLNRK